MESSGVPTYLRRYTDLPALIHLLRSQQLTLLDPKTWDDQNDSHFMAIYKDKQAFKTVLALCFSQSPETYHHWRVFSHGPSGVCIVFDRASLLEDLQRRTEIRMGQMEYLTMSRARTHDFRIDELPFLKRYGYRPENEFRAIYTSTDQEIAALPVAIRLQSIRGISLSPWMHATLAKSTVAALRAIPGCERLKVSRSTLISNEQWKRYGASAS